MNTLPLRAGAISIAGNPLIIGFGVKRYSGKDTACDELVHRHGAVKVSFALALKRVTAVAFGWTEEQVLDDVRKSVVDPYWGISPSQALQVLGTELFRTGMTNAALDGKLPEAFADTSFWIRRLGKELAAMATGAVAEGAGSAVIVISDVRFPDEADFIIDTLGGFVVRVDRDEELRIATAAERGDTRDPNHDSEIALDRYTRWSGEIDNSHSKAYLYDRVEELFRDFVAHRRLAGAGSFSATT